MTESKTVAAVTLFDLMVQQSGLSRDSVLRCASSIAAELDAFDFSQRPVSSSGARPVQSQELRRYGPETYEWSETYHVLFDIAWRRLSTPRHLSRPTPKRTRVLTRTWLATDYMLYVDKEQPLERYAWSDCLVRTASFYLSDGLDSFRRALRDNDPERRAYALLKRSSIEQSMGRG